MSMAAWFASRPPENRQPGAALDGKDAAPLSKRRGVCFSAATNSPKTAITIHFSPQGVFMKRIATALLALALAAAPALAQTSVTSASANSQPESMAVGPDGTLYIGSQLDARIYRAR